MYRHCLQLLTIGGIVSPFSCSTFTAAPARLHNSLHGSHYSVLFGRQVAERGLDPLTLSAKEAPDRFDLVYYDELAMQDEPIILTVDQYPDQPLSPMELGTDKNRCDFNAGCVCVCKVCVCGVVLRG